MAYVTTNVVAKELGVSADTVRRWGRTEPAFPRKNIGTEDRPNWRYVIEDVKAYLEERSR